MIKKFGYDEMVFQRFVTLYDEVQETVFISGKRAVVNFADLLMFLNVKNRSKRVHFFMKTEQIIKGLIYIRN